MEINEDKVREAIASILKKSLIRIQSLAIKSDYKAIDDEANHVHNLPKRLFLPVSLPDLNYYFNVERKGYLEQGNSEAMQWYKEEWAILELYLNQKNKNEPPSSL